MAFLFAVTACLVYVTSDARFLGDTASSRLATVLSLVHNGTWRIDRPAGEAPNPFEQATVDKVRIGEGMYSTKPPLLPLLMAGEYYLLHHGAGLDLQDRADLKLFLRISSLTLVGLPFLICLLCFAGMLRWFVDSAWVRLAACFCLAYATQLFGLSDQIDNHVPAAGALMAALYYAAGLGLEKLRPLPHRFFLFGLCTALTFAIDMPVTLYAAFAGLYLLARFPRQAILWGGTGLLLPLAVHFGVLMAATGSPLPIQMRPNLYLYEDSYWRNPVGRDALAEPKGVYFFHMTFGRFGVFSLFPILIIGLVGAGAALAKQAMPYRRMILTGMAAFALITLYYVVKTNNYGGAAYGFRWHIASMPVLLLMGAPVWNRLHRPWHWAVLILVAAVSCYSCYECFRMPWGEHQEWTCRFLGTSY